jgi:hypothetical protein
MYLTCLLWSFDRNEVIETGSIIEKVYGWCHLPKFLIVDIINVVPTHVNKHWYIHHDFMILFKCIVY